MNRKAIAALSNLGHVTTPYKPDASYGLGGAQLIQRIDGAYLAGSDHRKGGAAVGR